MADIVITGTYTPPGGIITLNEPGQRLTSGDGHQAIVQGAVYITAAADGATIDETIKIEVPAGFTAQAGAVQCCASNAGIHCEIDIGGNPMQGVQIVEWGAGVPDSVDISNLNVYNNTQSPLAEDVNENHGIYVQDSTRLYGDNLRFSNIQGGWAIHFYCDQTVQVCTDSLLRHITCDGNRADVIFWGPGVTNNKVERLLSLNVGEGGVLHQNASAENVGNTLDYVTTPQDDYGHQGSPMPECLYIISGTPENPAVIDGAGIDYDYIWGNEEHDCIVKNAVIRNPPPGDMPKMFGCSNVHFINCSITGVRANGAHVEGIHLNGCRNITFEDFTFDDNDIFHVFITQWGEGPSGNPYPTPENIHFVRCRFGLIGPGGGYYSVKVRDEGGVYTPCPGITFQDVQRKGPTMDTPGATGLNDILVVPPNSAYPPFSTDIEEPPDPEEPPPVDAELETRVDALEAQMAALTQAAVHIDQRVDVIEEDMNTLG